MNQRIKKLMRQVCKDSISPESVLEIVFDNHRDLLEKFAELIVRECIAQCEKNKDHEWLGPGSKLSAFNIKEHFEVE